jgi:hypothetical protein
LARASTDAASRTCHHGPGKGQGQGQIENDGQHVGDEQGDIGMGADQGGAGRDGRQAPPGAELLHPRKGADFGEQGQAGQGGQDENSPGAYGHGKMGLPEKTPIVENKEDIGEGGIPEDQPEQSQGFAETFGPVSLFGVRLAEFSPETEGRHWRERTRFGPIKTTVHTIVPSPIAGKRN